MQINIKLDKSFTTAFNQLCEEFGEDFKKLNGFSDSQLNYGDFIDNFVDKNVKSVADASIDGNANASTRDITSLEIEMSKPHMKLLAFNKIFYELNKKYGYQIACDWLRNEWIGYFYMHDAFSSTFKSYCFAYDIEGLVKNGLYFIANNFNNQPPKHLVTYTDFVGEFVSWVSNRTSGACGLPSFLIYSYYFWKKDIENDYNGLNSAVVPGKRAAAKRLLGLMKQKDEAYRKNLQAKYRDQEFQRIIYKLNQPYLRVTQSAFTNFSIFDESYLVELFGSKKFPDGTPIIDYIDEIIQYQKDFMTVCSEVRSQNMMTFPVLTYALLFQDGHYVHEDFAKWCVRHNMKWADSNFFNSSDVTSLSNCCVDGKSAIVVLNTITNKEEIYKIEDFVYLFDPNDEEFIKTLETNYKIKSFNYNTGEFEYKDIQGVVRKNNNYEFLYKFTIDGNIINVTPDHRMEVIEIATGEHKTISASELYRHIDEYEVMVEC